MATIFQAPLLTNFLYPLLLVFFITYAVLEKIKIFGSEGEKKQLHAGIALLVSLIFVGAVFPKIIVANMVQFMTVGLVIIFVSLMLWGFVSGQGKFPDGMVKKSGWIVGLAVLFAVIWATGVSGPVINGLQKFFAFLFDSSWSGTFWTNALFIGIIAIAIAVVLGKGDGKK